MSVTDISPDTTDVNGNPIVFVNPLPPSASNEWFTEVKINDVDVEFTEGKMANDIPITGFTQGFSDEAFVINLRRPFFNNNEFVKFSRPTILSAGSTLKIAVDKDKIESYTDYHYRILITSLTEDSVDCPRGFKSMSARSGIINLGYNYNWESRFARGCKRKNKVSHKDHVNERNRRLELTATSDWVVVFTVFANIDPMYLETTNENPVMRSTIENSHHFQVRNQIAQPFRSHRITQL